MKKNLFFIAFAGVMAWSMTACEPKTDPEQPEQKDSIPSSFPKKHLIEEFTGQGCGYCPYGMDCISEFVANDTNWILVLHHYGYQADHFSVKGSQTITNQLKVNGAPSMTIDRTPTRTEEGTEVVFHPDYLPSVDHGQFDQNTYASVVIDNEFDPATRELKVKVSGALCKEDYPLLKLTVLVKESGMIDSQADYYGTFEGWEEFRHANAVRAFLTDPKGDYIAVNDDFRYTSEYSLQLDNDWKEDNCMVVAFLSDNFQPVVQAEQRPAVTGTKGGADIVHGGIKAVPVSDFYPEPNATDGPANFSGNQSETLDYALAYYTPYTQYGFNFWTIMAYNQNTSLMVNNTECLPFAYIYFFTELNQTDLPTGSFELNLSEEPGSAFAGYRDDEYYQIGGSEFYFTNRAYFSQGYLVPETEWLIVDGTLTIETDGWRLNGHARNGARIRLTGSTPIQNYGRNMPARIAGKRTAALKDTTPSFVLTNHCAE